MILKLTISIDDACPKPENRILGEQSEKWLRSLNEEFGCCFDLFIPSNYHNEWSISEHKEWIRELNSISWISLNAHGHFHQTSDPQWFGECEFAELNDPKEVIDRISAMWNEWIDVDIFPQGFRPPGWLVSNESQKRLDQDTFIIRPHEEGYRNYGPLNFEYVAVHYEHNHRMKWNCKTFFGHDGIHQTDIGIHNQDMIMFQSHIAGDWNDNVWNEQNYNQLRLSLEHLCTNHQIEFKLLKECL